MLTHLNGIPTYRASVESESYDNLIDEKVKDLMLSKDSTPDTWDCSVLVDYDASTWGKLFVDSIGDYFVSFIKELEYDSSIICNFDSPWLNVYLNGDYQEMHDHMPFHFSYAYVHQCYENSGDFVFVNTSTRSLVAHYENKNVVNTRNYLNLKEKEILFFPSFMCHMVTQNKTNKPRVTISGNIELGGNQ